MCNYCNNFCNYCRYVGMPASEKKSILFEDFKHYVAILQGLGVKGFILTGGEPTISRDFDKITAWLEENGIPYGVNTNFNVLKLIKPRYLKVSLDGYDAISYKEDRKIDKYDAVIGNLKQYIAWKKENQVQTAVGIQKVGMNVEECRKFYEAHADLDVDYMAFRPVESVNHVFYDNNDEKPIIEYLERLRSKDSRVQVNYKYYHVRDCFEKCHANYLQITVNPSGEVIYCCSKSNDVVGRLDDPEILAKMANYPNNMASCPVPCRMTGPNMLVRDMETQGRDSMFI